MGLDMYVWEVKKRSLNGPVGELKEGTRHEEFRYWRKHPNLHGWMENLYHKKGGEDIFNCVYVELTKKDLESLYKDLVQGKLPETTGFFFGKDSKGLDTYAIKTLANDLDFVADALDWYADPENEDYALVYYSWW